MEKTDNNKAVNTLTEVEQADSDSSLGDETENNSVDKANMTIVKKGKTITVESKVRKRRDSQIEATIGNIKYAIKDKEQSQLSRENGDQQLASNMNGPCGLVLNPRMISLGGFRDVGIVLGEGNTGKVIVKQDSLTQEKVAYKTIPDSEFNGDGIRASVGMADEDVAPELYHFRLVEGKVEGRVEFSMEILEGMTLKQATDRLRKMHENDRSIREQLSLWVLYELLEIRYKLQPFRHGDIHAGNVILENSMTVKLIDFDNAKNSDNLSYQDKVMTMRDDLVGIIRIFCALYSGVDVNNFWDAKDQRQPTDKDLYKLSESMCHIPEASRKQLFEIMRMLYDPVRDPNQEGFGDTSSVAKYIKPLLPEDVEMFKKKVAAILFPEKHQKVDGGEYHGSDNFTPDSLDDCVKNITLKDL